MKASQLDCVGYALLGAQHLELLFPTINFTSGRRSRRGQCWAMSEHLIGDKYWILGSATSKGVYQWNDITNAMHTWCLSNPQIVDRGEIADGLLTILNRFCDEDLARMNFFHHLSGRAFDIEPINGDLGLQVLSEVKKLLKLGLLLTKEGNDIVWHAQFKS